MWSRVKPQHQHIAPTQSLSALSLGTYLCVCVCNLNFTMNFFIGIGRLCGAFTRAWFSVFFFFCLVLSCLAARERSWVVFVKIKMFNYYITSRRCTRRIESCFPPFLHSRVRSLVWCWAIKTEFSITQSPLLVGLVGWWVYLMLMVRAFHSFCNVFSLFSSFIIIQMSTSLLYHLSQFQLANKYLIAQVKHAQNMTERYAQVECLYISCV